MLISLIRFCYYAAASHCYGDFQRHSPQSFKDVSLGCGWYQFRFRGLMSSKPSKWVLVGHTRRTTRKELRGVFCRRVYFHLCSKIYFWPSNGGRPHLSATGKNGMSQLRCRLEHGLVGAQEITWWCQTGVHISDTHWIKWNYLDGHCDAGYRYLVCSNFF